MTDKQNMRLRNAAGAKSRMAGRKLLLCGVSTLTLAVSGLCATAAFADPAITYSGDLSPAPVTGTTNWTPDGPITMGVNENSTLTVSGGATITAPKQTFNFGENDATGHNSTFTIDGAGTKVELGGISMGIGNGSNDQLIIRNGASLDLGVSSVVLARGPGTFTNPGTASMLVTGQGTTVKTGSIAVGGSSNMSASLRIEDGAKVDAVNPDGTAAISIGYGTDHNPEGARHGEVIVTGAGTELTTDFLRMGASAPTATTAWGQEQGVLTIADGAVVKVNTASSVMFNASVINIGAAAGQAPTAAGTLDASELNPGGGRSQEGIPGPTINFNHTGDTVFNAAITTSVSRVWTINQLAGVTKLTGDSSGGSAGGKTVPKFNGAVNISGGTLQLGDGGTTGSLYADITNNSTLAFNRSNAYKFDTVISGTGDVVQLGSGTLTLSGVNTYSGGTKLNAGTIAVASDAALGAASGALSFNGGALNNTAAFTSGRTFDFGANGGFVKTDKTLTLNGAITGAGNLIKNGDGELVYNGDGSAHTGATNVLGGTFTLHGKLGGAVQVSENGTLDGDGTITGNTHIVGGTLSGVSGQTLQFNGDLKLDTNSKTNVAMGADTDAMFNVTGDLTVGGTLNISDDGGFGIGVNNVFHADGVVTNTNLTIGTVDPAIEAANISLTVGQHDVTLTNTGGLTLGYWDGANTTGDGTVHGGTGTWGTGNNWTNENGTANGPWVDAQFAIFGGTAGTVTIAPAGVGAAGMQFAVDGYTMGGGTLTLANGNTAPIIRVGDGSAGSDATKATISAVIAGTNGLNKTGKGTLILTGANTYTGDTKISLGTLQLGAGGAMSLSME